MNKKEKYLPLVSIITVNYNGKDYLGELYKSLRHQKYHPVELILVDNASSDDSIQFVKENFPEVKIIQNSENYMFARGNNIGIEAARGEIICLLNNDIKVAPDFLEKIIPAFEANPEMAACQPKVLDMSAPDHFEYAGASGGFIDKYGYPFMRGRIFFTLEKDQGQYDDIVEIFWSTGACFLIRKTVIADLGSLDEDFKMHMEEIDLCWRMHLSQYKIYCVPAAKVWHKGGGTLSAESPHKIYWNFRNNIFLLAKNLEMLNLLRIFLIRIGLDGIALLREMFQGKFKCAASILKGYGWIFFNLRLLFRKRSTVQKMRKVRDRKIFELIYPGSIVWEYFVRGRQKFAELKKIQRILQ
ncbi:MAG: glycosyltransferase family 2 protein [Calditrichia bacterium]|nr:glycosyltransferase family 2 protein [Calditrichia bacterium]